MLTISTIFSPLKPKKSEMQRQRFSLRSEVVRFPVINLRNQVSITQIIKLMGGSTPQVKYPTKGQQLTKERAQAQKTVDAFVKKTNEEHYNLQIVNNAQLTQIYLKYSMPKYNQEQLASIKAGLDALDWGSIGQYAKKNILSSIETMINKSGTEYVSSSGYNLVADTTGAVAKVVYLGIAKELNAKDWGGTDNSVLFTYYYATYQINLEKETPQSIKSMLYASNLNPEDQAACQKELLCLVSYQCSPEVLARILAAQKQKLINERDKTVTQLLKQGKYEQATKVAKIFNDLIANYK